MSESASVLVASIQADMIQEFRVLNTTPSQYCYENFMLYRSSLEEITEHSTVYKDMLNSISTAYNSEISRLYEARKKKNFQSDSSRELEQANETIDTLKARITQLNQTMTALNLENVALTESIDSMKELVADISAQSLLVEEDVYKNRVLGHMTLEQMTNVNLLSRELGKLEQRYHEMLETQSSEYVMKDKFEEARALLLKKEERKEAKQDEIFELHRVNPVLKQLLEVLQNSGGKQFTEIYDAARQATQTVSVNKSQLIELYDDEDPAKEKEAEVALANIEQLEELLRDGNFNSAAVHAANSPNGFLRTMNTIEEFKSLCEGEGGVSPLFVYCTILMETVPQYTLPPEDQSFECVQAALKQNRLDLIAKWIANKHLTLSRAMADLLLCDCQCRIRCDCESGTLALAVFRSIKDHEMSINCLARQGALYRAVHYAKTHKLGKSKLLILLKANPSIDLAALLIFEEGLNLGEVLSCLQENHHDNIFIGLLKVLDENNDLKDALLNDKSPENVQWSEFVEVCAELGETDIAEELQGYIITSTAINNAKFALSPSTYLSE